MDETGVTALIHPSETTMSEALYYPLNAICQLTLVNNDSSLSTRSSAPFRNVPDFFRLELAVEDVAFATKNLSLGASTRLSKIGSILLFCLTVPLTLPSPARGEGFIRHGTDTCRIVETL